MPSSVPPFAVFLDRQYRRAPAKRRLMPGECTDGRGHKCALCHAVDVAYEPELEIKRRALVEFWKRSGLDAPLDELAPAPAGRAYRSVSKRRVFHTSSRVALGLIGVEGGATGERILPVEVGACAIEPPEHAEVYAVVRNALSDRRNKDLAELTRYVVVKETLGGMAVLLNLRERIEDERPALMKLSKTLTAAVPAVQSIHTVASPGGSRSYSGEGGRMQKVWGRPNLASRFGGKTFTFDVGVFQQTNPSVVESMAAVIDQLLGPEFGELLVDLYSGYGLWSLLLADRYPAVIGADASRAATEAARRNAERNHAKRARYVAADVTAESVRKLLRNHPERMDVILDPPRAGTKRDVIETLGEAPVRRAVHIFCDVDRLPVEARWWRAAGYRLTRAVPIDMFPGTDAIEVVCGFERAE
jgi:23S rRNA (uracil1939-C5)-methyltransferase